MASSQNSYIGIAKQTAKGTPNITDNLFKYLLFSQGSMAPSNVVVPLDPEVGGGAMLRDMKKMGVVSGGGLEIVPRPATLGMFLMGALGHVVSTPGTAGDAAAITHVMDMGADQFQAPYYTLRSAPGNMWGEQFQDCRVSALGLEWRGANFLRGSVGFQGGMPSKVATTTWLPTPQVDGGPQFITPISTIELPTGSALKVLSGSFSAGMAIPLDEQWIVGNYSPDAMDIVSRSFALQLVVKIEDATLYSKVTYDPAGGSTWIASLMREGRINLDFKSDMLIATTTKAYELKIEANGQQNNAANVVWSASPIGLRAGRQVIMALTGVFMADPAGTNQPIKVTLTNDVASY